MVHFAYFLNCYPTVASQMLNVEISELRAGMKVGFFILFSTLVDELGPVYMRKNTSPARSGAER